MREAIAVALLGAVALLPAGNAMADHATHGFGHAAAGPIVTVSASTLPKGEWSFGLRAEYVKFDAIPDERFEQLAAGGTEAHSVSSLLSPFLGAAYGVTDDLTLSAHVPYVIRRDIRAGHLEDGTPEVHAEGDSKGIGDATFLAQYRFLNRPGPALEAAFLAGVKLPTGKTSERTSSGARFETDHQPGSGSWDPLAGVALTKRLDSWSFDVSAIYTLATEGSRDTDLGDVLHGNASVSFRFGNSDEAAHSHPEGAEAHAPHPARLAWDLILEANAEWQAKQKIAGVRDVNSGGSLLYLSPGVRATAYDRCSAYLSVGIPVHEDRNGVQHEVDYRVIAGVDLSF